MISIVNVLLTMVFTVFAISSLPKLISLKHFAKLVADYQIVPRKASMIIGFTLPFFEVLSCIFLFADGFILTASFAFLLLLIAFSFAVFKSLAAGKKIHCGCYGKFIDSEADSFTIFKLISLLVSMVIVLISFTFVPMENLKFEFHIIGFALGLMLLVLQILWTSHRRRLQILSQ
ncbi:MauE/DoxX family redox-associated membrane protein [Bacillus sp. FJAT-27251]|uniref:MauE/DoxX family redox-associated membrane protein n=1 Tax=Bacillus sp. FJAT-27251 TaxID=1684142 RepID=UPI0006A7AD58|nr:MauE/DoxX family redox-associated membrane protein [Bacillus sp. FJAT-27251]